MSTAPKFDRFFNEASQSIEAANHPIDSFDQVAAALQMCESFRDFDCIHDEHKVQLSFEGINIFLLNTSIWQCPKGFDEYLRLSEDFNNCVLCLGDESSIAEHGEHFVNKEIEFLQTPVKLQRLHLKIRRVLKSKKQMAELSIKEIAADHKSETVKYILSISRELNGVRDIPKLLNLILKRAREVTQADAGSIYTVEVPERGDLKDGSIHFKITQNHSVPQNLSEFSIPINESSIVGNAVINKARINIPDLYDLDEDPSKNPWGAKHDRTWDERIGYECHSMLTIPMFDISHSVIGVIQLINRKNKSETKLLKPADFQTEVMPFDDQSIEYAEIIAHQAGVALENALLTDEKEALFEGFVDASVKAIEQRDPTTSGHSGRVAALTCGLAEMVDRVDTGLFKDTTFDVDQLKEIKFASLLHDFGKVGVQEKVLVKAKKLYPWEECSLLERWELIRSRNEVQYLRDYVRYLEAPSMYPPGFSPNHFRKEMETRSKELEEFLQFILECNEPTVLEQEGFEKLKDIANHSYSTSNGHTHPYLKSTELKALSVSRGSLTREEFAEIQSHVTHTYEFLRKIPWGRKFANVPQIAAKHHEKLDGSGYPNGSFAEEIPVQSRMMTIADIFDALTASDRPYKKAVPPDRALDIIGYEVKAGKCDKELYNIFVESGIYKITLDQ